MHGVQQSLQALLLSNLRQRQALGRRQTILATDNTEACVAAAKAGKCFALQGQTAFLSHLGCVLLFSASSQQSCMSMSQTAVSEQQSQLGQRLQSLKAVTLRASAVGDQLAEGNFSLERC